MSDKWSARFLEMADLVASWSKDPSTKVGAVIVDDKKRIVSIGFNGFPRGVQDKVDVKRETKLARTIHAELNAILFAPRPVAGCSIIVTRPPCSNCAATIIQTGISTVVFRQPDPEFAVRWADSIQEAVEMFREAKIQIICAESTKCQAA